MTPRPKLQLLESDVSSCSQDDYNREDSSQETQPLKSAVYSAYQTCDSPSCLSLSCLDVATPWNRLPPATSLPVLVFIDMLAVSLVVPLLVQYYRDAGITSASQRESLSSLFSASQIAGGLLLGWLTDAHGMESITVLRLSFVGSALSYALIAGGGFYPLIISRVLVGLVKQTVTVTTTLLTQSTTPSQRTRHMGHLSAASTVAWIVGPSLGAFLYHYIHPRAPPILASILFAVDLFLAAIWLRPPSKAEPADGIIDSDDYDQPASKDQQDHLQSRDAIVNRTGRTSVLSNLKSCFTSETLVQVVAVRLLLTWVGKAMSCSQLGNFYETLYKLEPYHRGYLSSYQQLLQFIMQSLWVGKVLQWCDGERSGVVWATAIATFISMLEYFQSWTLFVILLQPLQALCCTMMHIALQSLVTRVTPTHSVFAVLAALDVLQNAVSVSVPFYRAFLFQQIQYLVSEADPSSSFTSSPDRFTNNTTSSIGSNTTSSLHGDPDPIAWILCCIVHWFAATIVTAMLLRTNHCVNKGTKEKSQ